MVIKFDNTEDNRTVPISASFIENDFKKIPSDYVKIYVYLLYLKNTAPDSEYSLEDISGAININKDIVLKALGYFEALNDSAILFKMDEEKRVAKEPVKKTGKVRRVLVHAAKKPAVYTNEEDKDSDFDEEEIPGELSYYKQYHSDLQAIFSTRELTRSDYEKADEWIEVYGLPTETATYLASYMSESKGEKISFAYISKVAQSWAEMGLTTIEEAQDYAEFQDAKKSDAREVLKAIGVYKMPSEAEKALYEKWVTRWGFSKEAILEACFDTAKTTTPSFAYLDTILHGYYKKGLFTPNDMRASRGEEIKYRDGINEILFELGLKSTANKTYKELYDKWTNLWGFSHEAILLACSKCMVEGNKTIKALDEKLKDYKDNSILTAELMKAQMQQKDIMDDDIKIVYERAGLDTPISPSARTLYTKWANLWKLPHELILLAAEQVITQNNKLQKIDGLLQNWRINGINTVSLAKKALKKDNASVPYPSSNKTAPNYQQHNYNETDLAKLIHDFDDEE